MQTLLKNGRIFTMDTAGRIFENGSVLVEKDRIRAVGKVAAELLQPNADVIDLHGKYVLPGFVNTHVHTSQQISRGVGDDVDFLTWLHKRMWPYESHMTEEDSYISTLICCVEQIRAGVTSFAEPGGQFVPGMARAVEKAGIRAKLAKSVMDCGEGLPQNWRRSADEELAQQEADLCTYNNTADGRVQVWFGLRTIINDSDDLIVRTKELADHYGVGVHMHVAEAQDEIRYTMEKYGEPTVTHLNRLGVLDRNLLAVHTVWLTDEEIAMLHEHDVKVSHNPASAMRVLGFAKIPEMIEQGVCVSIGTDGASSSNRMDIVDEMWLTSLIHKGRRLDPTIMPAESILKMATINGARALLDEALYGSLEVGKKADLIVINPRTASMYPVHDPVASLVTAMHSNNVESTMCDGKWLMRARKLLHLDEEAILDAAQEHGAAIYKRAGIVLPPRFPVVRV